MFHMVKQCIHEIPLKKLEISTFRDIYKRTKFATGKMKIDFRPLSALILKYKKCAET